VPPSNPEARALLESESERLADAALATAIIAEFGVYTREGKRIRERWSMVEEVIDYSRRVQSIDSSGKPAEPGDAD
jgi:hypothetical protein